MQEALYEYLILNKKLCLPGIGTISLLQVPAQSDFNNKLIKAPAYLFSLSIYQNKPVKKLFEWLSISLGISELDAVKLVNDFSFEIKQQISLAGKMIWEKVGKFSRNINGDIELESIPAFAIGAPVAAQKVIREIPEHTILVGEEEKTAVEMQEYFADEIPQKNHFWIIAIIILVISFMYIGWYFSENGFEPSSTGNQTKIESN